MRRCPARSGVCIGACAALWSSPSPAASSSPSLGQTAPCSPRHFCCCGTSRPWPPDGSAGRREATLAALRRLERFRGHFFNWYDTSGLRPLEPRYVSTVDSGNLAGHLLVLANACRDASHQPLLDPEALAGIEDALLLVGEA